MEKENSVLLIFTGGTISMSEDPANGALKPIDFNRLQEYMPELKQTGVKIKSIPFLPLIDSNDILVVSSTTQIRVKAEEIPVLSRGTQGVKTLKLGGNSKVIKIQNF